MSGTIIEAADRFNERRARHVTEHQARIAVGRNKPLPEADELRFAAEVSRPCDSGEGE